MNKKRINDWILPAQKAIKDNKIPENGVVNKTYRGQISTFGAAVVMGSLKSAIAFFSDPNKASVDRSKLIKVMYQLITEKEGRTPVINAEPKEIFQYVCDHDTFETEEMFTDASIAIKLAFNLFHLVDDPSKYKDGKLKEGQGED